jgi:Transcriptional regulators
MPEFRRKISMQDIADKLGISKNAVSLALNNKPGVSEKLRKSVFEIARDLNYCDISPKKETGGYLLVIIQDFIKDDKLFYYGIFSSVERQAKELGYHAIIASITKEMEKELVLPELFYEMDFSGILLAGRLISRDYAAKVAETNLPVVMMVQNYYGLNLDYVFSANEEGSYNIVKYLIDNGHKDIGFIGSTTVCESFYERWSGYKRAMRESDLVINEEHCNINVPLAAIDDQNEFKALVNQFKSFPSAWFCGNDRMAISLINALNCRKIAVPDDISVVGFDGIEAASLITPQLTTVNSKVDAIGAESVDLLVRRLNNTIGREHVKLSISGEIILGTSVKQLV